MNPAGQVWRVVFLYPAFSRSPPPLTPPDLRSVAEAEPGLVQALCFIPNVQVLLGLLGLEFLPVLLFSSENRDQGHLQESA